MEFASSSVAIPKRTISPCSRPWSEEALPTSGTESRFGPGGFNGVPNSVISTRQKYYTTLCQE